MDRGGDGKADPVRATARPDGGYLLASGEDDEQEKVAALVGNQGVALLALGLSISFDELAMGFTIGLLLSPSRSRSPSSARKPFSSRNADCASPPASAKRIREGAEKLAPRR